MLSTGEPLALEVALRNSSCFHPLMKFLGLLFLSLVTASTQSDVGKLLVQWAANAMKVYESVPEMDRSAILTATAAL